ncbi:MAG TPA: twin-arginine translocase subunit TatB [Gammaproteobacteria bacterium]|nr:twin-arginine translocase subunit TatB [Gammaproteobacteria bacterium]
MFDIGFWEIALIAVVALLVVGPEEFPALVRTIGAVLGKVRRFVQEAKQELDREVLQAEELKRLVEKEAKIAELHRAVEEVNATIPVDPPPAAGRADAPEAGQGKSTAAADDASTQDQGHGSSKEISS